MSNNVKPFNSGQIFKPLARTGIFLAREVAEAAKNDPALAMRLAAGALVPPILDGVSPDVTLVTANTIVPVVRGALLAMNTMRCIETFKNPDSKGYEKGADVIRVVSDMAGMVGGLAMLFTPQYAALGAKLMGTAYSVDIVSHAFRGLTHGAQRIKLWQNELNEKPDDHPPGPGDGPGSTPPTPPNRINPAKPLAQLEQPRQLKLFQN
ncbi:hypothetical protein IV102_23885 [bacterium]|nr:hypothetical protein [bacterium]